MPITWYLCIVLPEMNWAGLLRWADEGKYLPAFRKLQRIYHALLGAESLLACMLYGDVLNKWNYAYYCSLRSSNACTLVLNQHIDDANISRPVLCAMLHQLLVHATDFCN